MQSKRHLSTAEIASIVRANGFLLSSERRVIVETLIGCDRPVDAKTLWRMLPDGPRISQGTVHRTLRLFNDLDILERVVVQAPRPGMRSLYRLRGPAKRLTLVVESGQDIIHTDAADVVQAIESFVAAIGYRLAGGIELRVRPLR